VASDYVNSRDVLCLRASKECHNWTLSSRGTSKLLLNTFENIKKKQKMRVVVFSKSIGFNNELLLWIK
jgi:hypothetical protein